MALGKGLGALIPPRASGGTIKAGMMQPDLTQGTVQQVPISQIIPNPQQPRHHFGPESLSELAQSIKEHGILQPLLVTEIEPGKYQLIAGERRFRAAKLAGLESVPVSVRKASELESLELALIENIQRADLNPMERAEGYEKLMHDFGLGQEDAARRLGVSRSQFANTTRLLQLPSEVQLAIAAGKLTESHAKTVLSLDVPSEQIALMNEILGHNLSVRDAEQRVAAKPKARRRPVSPRFSDLEDRLRETLGTKVTLKPQSGGKGQIVIAYYSDEELNRIINSISS